MRRSIICIFFLSQLVACNNLDSGTNNSKHLHLVDTIPKGKSKQATFPLDMGCYYKLDDKYSESEDTAEINKWWRKKLKEFEYNGFQNNLFAKKGGGPHGAEWNSSTDLFIAATINKTLNNETIELKLNKKKISRVNFFKYFPIHKIGTIIYFKLPRALWEKHLRKINAEDFEGIYGKENIESVKENLTAPLDAGEVVEITIYIRNSKNSSFTITDFFHIAYGE